MKKILEQIEALKIQAIEIKTGNPAFAARVFGSLSDAAENARAHIDSESKKDAPKTKAE